MELKKCLMITPVFPPRNSAGIFRTLRFCRYLPEFGWIPSVCTMNSSDPKDCDPKTFNLDSRSVILRMGAESTESVVVPLNAKESPMGEDRKRSSLGSLRSFLRPFRELIFETPDRYVSWANLVKGSSRSILERIRPDLIYSSGPPHSTHLAAMHVAKQSRVPWVADFRDPWARLPWELKRNPLGRKLIPRMERQVVEKADLVVLNNQSSKEDFCRAYPGHVSKFEAIPNGIDPLTRFQIEQIQQKAVRNPLNDDVTICHAGNLYGHRNPRLFLEALAQLRKEGIRVRFRQIGYVEKDFQAEALIRTLGIQDAVSFDEPVPHVQALEAMAQADILLIVQPDASVMVPAKLFEMMVFQKPIMGICDSPSTEKIIDDYGGGSAPSRDMERIKEMIRQGITQLDVSTEVSKKRRATCDSFDGIKLAGVMARHMDQLVSASN